MKDNIKRHIFSGNRLGKGIESLKNFYSQLGFSEDKLKDIFAEIDRVFDKKSCFICDEVIK